MWPQTGLNSGKRSLGVCTASELSTWTYVGEQARGKCSGVESMYFRRSMQMPSVTMKEAEWVINKMSYAWTAANAAKNPILTTTTFMCVSCCHEALYGHSRNLQERWFWKRHFKAFVWPAFRRGILCDRTERLERAAELAVIRMS